jgi:hypothetical protein
MLESKWKYNLERPRRHSFLQVTPSKYTQAASMHTTIIITTTINHVIKNLIPTRNKMKISKKTITIR